MRTRELAVVVIALAFAGVLASGTTFAVELPFVENGVLYKAPADRSPGKTVIAFGVRRIVDYNHVLEKLLYVTLEDSPSGDIPRGGDLMLLDMPTQAKQYVASGVLAASLSPDGAKITLWNKDDEVQLIGSDGTFLRKIGIHGAVPLFSHDGNLIAYQKLADSPPDESVQSLFEFAQGIAVYDVRTGRETLVTDGGVDDFAPVGFSQDLAKLYFSSTRPYPASPENHVASLWVVDLRSRNVRRLTNNDEEKVRNGTHVPIISPNALWSPDRGSVITSNGPETGVWKFVLTGTGASFSRITDGGSPRWVVPDDTFAVRTISNGKSVWRSIRAR